MNTEYIVSFLTRSDLDDNQEAQEGRRLAAEGSSIVLPLLRSGLAELKKCGPGLSTIFTRALADKRVNVIQYRIGLVLNNVCDSSARGGEAVAQQLIGGMRDRDPDLRALSAASCDLSAISPQMVMEPLVRFVAEDADMVVKTAAAIILCYDDFASRLSTDGREIVTHVRDHYIESFVKQATPYIFAEVVRRLGETDAALSMILRLSFYRFIAIAPKR